MDCKTVCLSVPSEAAFARTVRMAAANLAVLCGMSVDDVEDVRMAAEEGFVYACATKPTLCELTFTLGEGAVAMDFALGADGGAQDDELSLVALLLSAVCDEFEVTEEGKLHLLKRGDGTDA